MALNLSYSKGDSKVQQNQNSQPISISMDNIEAKHHRERQGMSKTMGVYRSVQGGFEALSERDYGR